MVDQVNKILRYGIHVKTFQPKKIAVDFSSPNIAKDMVFFNVFYYKLKKNYNIAYWSLKINDYR